MLFGLVGSSGVGKTTLAKAVAESLGITFIPTSITACAKKHGFDAVGVMTLTDRIRLQLHLLEDHLEMIKAAERPLIVDRTPIDFIGYMMAEFDMHSGLRATDEEIQAAADYVQLCLDATVQYYDFMFCLSQLDSYEVSSTRPALNRAYQTHSQLVMEGALNRLTNRVSYALVTLQDFDARQDFVHDTIVDRMNEIEREKRSSPHVH